MTIIEKALEAAEEALEAIDYPSVQKALDLVRSARASVAAEQDPVGFFLPPTPEREWWEQAGCDDHPEGIALYTASIQPVRQEPTVRFCPHCGSVGEVESKFKNCCPDGQAAQMVPKEFAEKCHHLFELAIGNVEKVLAQTDPTWIIVNRDGFVPRRMGPFFDPVLIDKTLRELAERYPDALCTVLEAPATMYPTSGQEWLLMHEHNAT